jgi:TPR repeat protein
MRSVIQEFYGKSGTAWPVDFRPGLSKLVPSPFEPKIEVYVNLPHQRIRPVLFLALALMSALAQTAPSAVTIDPALLAKANAGDASSQELVADAYAAGKGGARDPRQLADDYKQAAAWYHKAADQGNTVAQIHLADLYRDGRGVARDPAQAATWYRKAAELGDAAAQSTLGILYSVGMGVPHDDVEAYYWLSLAASVKGPNQAKFAANRQSVGEHITTDQQAAVEDRVAKWQADHPHSAAAQ